jgi:chromosome segregation protein
VAAQYHDLRGTLTHKQNLLALARREASRNEAHARAELSRIETEEAAMEAALTHLDTELETVRESHYAASDACTRPSSACLKPMQHWPDWKNSNATASKPGA